MGGLGVGVTQAIVYVVCTYIRSINAVEAVSLDQQSIHSFALCAV